MRTLDDKANLAADLSRLAKADSRLRDVIRVSGDFAPRRRPAGFPGLARIIVGQQVSVASAGAIWARLAAAFPGMKREAIAIAADDALRSVGLSAPKIRTLRALATACADGLDLRGMALLPAQEVRSRLTAVTGIGPWTADIYLMFCLGHRDIFPAGDLALRNAVADALSLADHPVPGALADIAEKWAPWRSAAALLFWAYYSAARGKQGVPA